jgi:PAS domain S-box-containing protein
VKPVRQSLAAKALGLQLAALVAIAGVVGAARYYAIQAELYHEVQSSAQGLAEVFEDVLAAHPELYTQEGLDAIVGRLARNLPSVARVSIVDPRGMILVDSREAQGGPTDQPALRSLLAEDGEQRSSFAIAGSRYLRVSRSLRGRYDPARRSDIIGAVSLDMRLAFVDAAVRRELGQEMTLVLLLLVPIGGLLYLRTRLSFVRPLEQLAAAGAQFARGEIPAPLTFAGRDELAGVARTFNDMVQARTSALKDRERQLSEAQAIAHIGSWEFDMVANRVTWSDEAYHLWGLPLGSPVDYNAFIGGVHPEDRPRVEQLVGEGLAERRNIEFECRIVRPNGDVRYLFNRNIVVTNGTGEPIRLAGTCLDITEQKITEEQLRASMAEVKVLQGILPICASCKRIRTDGGEWEAVESYVRERTNAEFSHGLCPDCARRDWGAGASHA